MAALAHAGDDHPTAAAPKDLNRLREAVDEVASERRLERAQALGFELQGARRRGNRLAAVVAQQAIPLKADRQSVPPFVAPHPTLARIGAP